MHAQIPSDAELEILQILWKYEPATVRFVHEQLNLHKDVGYTTTLKQMQRMLEKGLISRETEKDGSSHEYRAVIKEKFVQENLVEKLLDKAFKGSSMKLVMHALGEKPPSPDELEELIKWLETIKDQKGGSND